MRLSWEDGNADNELNAHMYNATINACTFSKYEDDFSEVIQITSNVFEQFFALPMMKPNA
jgi:hypothetical protein